MDPLKSGAIFHIKNIAAIRSPAVNAPVTSAAAVTVTSDRNANHASPSLGDEQAKIIKQKFDQIYRATPVPTAILGGHMNAPLGSQSMHLHPSPLHVAAPLGSQPIHLHPSPLHVVAPLGSQPMHLHPSPIMMKSPYQIPQYTHNEPYALMGPPIRSPRHVNNNSNDYHHENINDDEYILHSPSQTVANNDKNNDNKTNNNDNISKKRSQLLKNDSLLNLGKVDVQQPVTLSGVTTKSAVTTKSIATKSQNHISPPPAKLIAAVPKKRGRKKKSPSIIFNPSVDEASPRDGKNNKVFEPVYIIEDLSPDTVRRKRKESVDSDQEILNENSNDSNDRKITRSGRLSQPVMRLIDLPKIDNKETNSNYLEEDDDDVDVNRSAGHEQTDDDYIDESEFTDKKKRGRKKNSVINMKKAKNNKVQPMIVQHVPDNYQSPPKKWDPREMTVLYRAHAAADASDPNFWESVSSNMKSQGIDKGPDECQQLWFQSLQEAQKRKNNKIKAPSLAATSASEHIPIKKKGKAEIKRLAEEVAKADKEDDLFDYRRQLNDDQALQVNTYVDSGISEEFGDVISPLGPQPNKNSESPVDDITTKNDWKASYVHNLSKRVASITNPEAVPTMNKLGSTVKSKNKINNKKIVEGGISGVLDFKKGKVNVVLANNNSDDDEEEDIVDTEDDE